MVASDGEVPIFGQATRIRAATARSRACSGVYVREQEDCSRSKTPCRKMTSFPAQRLGLADRGVLRHGMKADIAVFDPARVRDTATFEKPHQYAEGCRS